MIEMLQEGEWGKVLLELFFISIGGALVRTTKNCDKNTITWYFWSFVRPCFYLACVGSVFSKGVFVILGVVSGLGMFLAFTIFCFWTDMR